MLACLRRAGIVLLVLALATGLSTSAEAGNPPNAFERYSMDAPIPKGARTEILVLGSVHLATLGDALQPAHLEPLLTRLEERFHPALVAVEALPGATIQAMLDREGTFGPVLQQSTTVRTAVKVGKAAQAALETTPDAARTKLAGLLREFVAEPDAVTAGRRREATLLAAAGFELPTAMLQWRYLAPKDRKAAGGLPTAVAEALNQRLAGMNEINTLGVTLAHRLGHQRIAAFDDHMDKDALLPLMPAVQALIRGSPKARALEEESLPYSALQGRQNAALEDGDLLPLYEWLNGDGYVRNDVAGQFHLFFEIDDENGSGRARSALWEVRNLNMASNIRRATADVGADRALVIVGVGHKAFLEAYLERMMDVDTVSFQEAIRPPR